MVKAPENYQRNKKPHNFCGMVLIQLRDSATETYKTLTLRERVKVIGRNDRRRG